MRTSPDTAPSMRTAALRLLGGLVCTVLAVVAAWTPAAAEGSGLRVVGLTQLGSFPAGVETTIVREVALNGVSQPARVCGWLDFDRDGAFAADEQSCADAVTGAHAATLRWVGTPTSVGVSYLRLRVGFTADEVQPTALSNAGKAEDYRLSFVAATPTITVRQVSASRKVTKAGDKLAVGYEVANTGNARLDKVALTAPPPTIVTCSENAVAGLAPLGRLRCTAVRVLSQDEIDSGKVRLRVTATGFTPPGSGVADARVSAVGEVVVIVVAPKPGIQLTMKASPTTVSNPGDVVTYELAATSTGNVSLSHVEVVDEIEGLGDLSCDGPQAVVLAPSEVLTCTAKVRITQADVDFGSLFNVAKVFAEAPGGDPEDPTDDVGAVADTTTDILQRPAIQLAYRTDPAARAKVGEQATFRLVGTNAGNVTLTRVKITDSLGAVAANACSPTGSVRLAPGASLQCTGMVRVSPAAARSGKIVDHAVVNAEAPYGDPTASADNVTDRVTATVSVRKAPTSGELLPDTGGVDGRLPGLGLLAVVLGSALILVGRRIPRVVAQRADHHATRVTTDLSNHDVRRRRADRRCPPHPSSRSAQ